MAIQDNYLTNEGRATQESELVGRTDVTQIIVAVIEAIPHSLRLFPDLYAHQVTKALLEAGLIDAREDT